MTVVRTCDAGCSKPIDPPSSAVLLVEDAGTPDEYRGFMHAECKAERVELMREIADMLGLRL